MSKVEIHIDNAEFLFLPDMPDGIAEKAEEKEDGDVKHVGDPFLELLRSICEDEKSE